ncbi:MAG: hypothetical protein CM15mP116_05800 [Synechococcus sp.]|nr:MAG: hypothetical protein CM15mP116_05800 [Synechococcus sp.]
MFILYILIGYLINPALRKASRQKIVTRERYTKGFFESFQAIVDLKLGLSEPYFSRRFNRSTSILRSQSLMRQFYPKYRGYLLSPFGISMIFLIGVFHQFYLDNKKNY